MSFKFQSCCRSFLFLFVLAVPLAAKPTMYCDTTLASRIFMREYGYVGAGVSGVNLDKTNSFLGTQGISSFSEVGPTFSLGGSKEMNRLIFESVLTAHFWRDFLDNNIRTSLFTGNCLWNAGFNIFEPEMALKVFPFFGLGIGINAMHIRNNTTSLTNLLNSSNPNVMLWQPAFLLNLGIGSDYIVENNESTRGLALGLRAGYTLAPSSDKRVWMENGSSLLSMPGLDNSGFFVRAIVGGWGDRKGKMYRCENK